MQIAAETSTLQSLHGAAISDFSVTVLHSQLPWHMGVRRNGAAGEFDPSKIPVTVSKEYLRRISHRRAQQIDIGYEGRRSGRTCAEFGRMELAPAPE